MENEKVLEVDNLHVSFQTYAGEVKAVRGVSFELKKGETLAFVGESGCGKTVTAKAVMRLLKPPFAEIKPESKIVCNGKDVMKMTDKELYKFRGDEISMIFQDPMTALNPTLTIGTQLMEPIMLHQNCGKKEAWTRAVDVLKRVGIAAPEKRMKEYPHQLSGGMRQRVMIAMAVSCEPRLLIADEPTTALDVTIQARILELIKEIQAKMGISVIYITHDLGVVAKVADYVNVMYAGKIVEKGSIDDIFYDPRHPYTWGLLSAMPDLDTKDDRLYAIPGSPPNLLHKVPGDAFAPRNIFALNIDYRKEPPMFQISNTHWAATWLLDERAPKVDMPPELRARIERMKQEGEKRNV